MKTIKQTIVAASLLLVPVLGVMSVASPAQALECTVLPDSICSNAEDEDIDKPEDSAIWDLLMMVVNIMAAGVAMVAVGGLIYGAILYTTSSGSPEQTKKAIGIITNVVIGILAFAVMWAFLQWLIPGGVW